MTTEIRIIQEAQRQNGGAPTSVIDWQAWSWTCFDCGWANSIDVTQCVKCGDRAPEPIWLYHEEQFKQRLKRWGKLCLSLAAAIWIIVLFIVPVEIKGPMVIGSSFALLAWALKLKVTAWIHSKRR